MWTVYLYVVCLLAHVAVGRQGRRTNEKTYQNITDVPGLEGYLGVDLLESLNITEDQHGVSKVVDPPIRGLPAWRFRSLFNHVIVPDATVSRLRSMLKNAATFYFVTKQHRKTLGTLVSIHLPGRVSPWLQLVSNLRTGQLVLHYHVREDKKLHQNTFELPANMGAAWSRMALQLHGSRASLYVDCRVKDLQRLVGNIDLRLPTGSLLYFRQEPGFKKKFIGAMQIARIIPSRHPDPPWSCEDSTQSFNFTAGWRSIH